MNAPTQAATKKAKPKMFEIEVSLGNDNEPVDIFVGGCEEGDFRIKRGHKVVVPESVLTRLDDAVLGVAERDEQDEMKVIMVDRKRFPYTIHRQVQ